MKNRITCSILFLLGFVFLSADAKPKKTDPAPAEIPGPPQAAEIDGKLLNVAVRASLAAAAENLLQAADDTPFKLPAPPRTTRKITGYDSYETKEVRYRWEEYKAPKYEPVYEEYETFKVGGGESVEARKMGTVKARRIVGRKKVGTVTRKRLVKDASGDVVRTHKKGIGPQYDDGLELWADKLTGDNALVLLALLKSGVPETDQRLQAAVQALGDHVRAYGLSDLTWNAAWTAAAFANLSNSSYHDVRDLAIKRVLGGQISQGDAGGMWGPLCITMDVLPVLVKHESAMSASLAALKEDIQEKMARISSDNRKEKLEAELAAAEASVKSMEELYRTITQQGLRFDKVTYTFSLKQFGGDVESTKTAGLPYYFYNQTLADLESTALALYALSEAAANGCLPAAIEVPDLPAFDGKTRSRGRGPTLNPRNSADVLGRSAAAVARRQMRNGTWDQCNLHQPCHAFESLGMPELKEEATPPPLTSVTTRATVGQGYSCLVNVGNAMAPANLMSNYGRHLMAGRRQVIAAAQSHLDRQEKPVMPEGRILRPYDLYFSMLGIHRLPTGLIEDHRDLWMRFAYEILELQDENATWESSPGKNRSLRHKRLHSSSLWAWKPFDLKLFFAEAARRSGKEPPAPELVARHWRQFFGEMARRQKGHHRYSLESTNRQAVSTALSMLFLADGVRPPVAGYLSPGKPPSPLLRAATSALEQRDGVRPTVLRLSADTIADSLSSAPVVYVAGSASLEAETVRTSIREYVQDGGVLVVECGTPGELTTLTQKLNDLLAGSTLTTLPANAGFMAGYRGEKPSMKILAGAEQQLQVLFVPAQKKYTQVVYLLLKYSAGEEYFSPDYAAMYFGETALVARDKAVAALRGEAAPERETAPSSQEQVDEEQ